MLICPSCGQENPAEARFCNACATPLRPTAQPREERKIVTVLFADLVGFTARAEQLDPEDVRALLAPFHARLRAELERHGGTVEKFIGDAVMALFGAPSAHEDDPERAVRAALAIRDWALEQEDELQIRIAVNTGEALITLAANPTEGEAMAAGDVVNTTARLQAAAPVNGVLVGESAYRATRQTIEYRDHEAVIAKGKTEPIRVWEAVQARSRFGIDLGEMHTPLVGRLRELDALRDALERARSRRQLQLVTLVGVPGIGKSRLVRELFKLVDSEGELTSWRQGRSLPYGEGLSFWALAEVVKAEAGILDSDSPAEVERKLTASVEGVALEQSEAEWMTGRLRSLLGASGSEDGESTQAESFSAWRSFLEGLAHRRPLVLVFEDLHWADDGLLDFVDQLVDWARDAPLLVLCSARPELLERRPGWGGGKPNAQTISLPPLDDAETARLLAGLLERAVLPAETQSQILARAGGNPLYAEQYAQMLMERGDGAELPLPETVQGIIAARLDDLSQAEKSLLQDASVVGKVFWLGAVAAISGSDRRVVEQALQALARRELVQRAQRSSVAGEAEYAFRHVLVRDSAYDQIPRGARAEKHRAAGDWVRALARPEDQAEMLAHHYSSALEYARAAGRDDPGLVDAARFALRDAGERSFSLGSFEIAASFYASALELWPQADRERPSLRYQYGRALVRMDAGRVEILKASVEELEAAGESELAADAAIETAIALRLLNELDLYRVYVDRALELVVDHPDTAAALNVAAAAVARLVFDGEYGEAIAAADAALASVESFRGPARVRLLEMRGFARVTLGDEGGLEDFETAISFGNTIRAYDQLQSAYNNLLAKQVALGRLRESEETFVAMKLNAERQLTDARRRWMLYIDADRAFILGDWSEALLVADRFLAEADTTTHYTEVGVLLIRAVIRLARGEYDGAGSDAARAIELARGSGDALQLGSALLVQATLLLEQGRRAEAAQLAEEALREGRQFFNLAEDTLLVDAAWVLRDLGLAAAFLELLQRPAPTPWTRAAAAICGDDLERAAAELETIGYRPGAAYCRLRLAQWLTEGGRRADADLELSRALPFFREVGAKHYLRKSEALLAASA